MKRMQTKFVVKVDDDGRPFIVIETRIAEPGCPRSLYALDLANNMTSKQALDIAKYLNEHIESLGMPELSGCKAQTTTPP